MIFANFKWYNLEERVDGGVWVTDEDGAEVFIPENDVEIVEINGNRYLGLIEN